VRADKGGFFGRIRCAKSLISLRRASWGFYPIVFMAPYINLTGPNALTVIQVGYTIADLVAKALFGVMIWLIAMRKSESDRSNGR